MSFQLRKTVKGGRLWGSFIMHRSSIFVLSALTFCLSLPVHGAPVKKQHGRPTFTGTFKTKDKVGTRGYSKEVKMHPTFLSQKLTGAACDFSSPVRAAVFTIITSRTWAAQ